MPVYSKDQMVDAITSILGPDWRTQTQPSTASGVNGSGTPFTVPEEISQGARHDIVYKFLRSQKARGVSLEVALVGCHALNKEQCMPPLEEKRLDEYLRRVWNQPDSPDFAQRSSAEDFRLEREGKHKGQILPNNLHNIRLALRKLHVQPMFDEFSQRALLDINGTLHDFDDRSATRLWFQLQEVFNFLPTRDKFEAVLNDLAWSNPRHPVKEYLDGLVWDGIPRIDEWLIAYGGAQDTEFVRAVSALMLMAAVRRVRQPGCKFDEMPVLESKQGLGKSSALRALCPNDEWFSDDLPLNVDAKQIIERTAGKWIIEASELNGHRKAQGEQLKSMTSRQTDGPVRLAYARLPVSKPRQFVTIGTTNAFVGYLKDSTGNRRFWPVHIEQFDVVALKRDRDQLWAEAAVREAAGESIRLSPNLYASAEKQQQQRELHDPWYELLSEEIDSNELEKTDTGDDEFIPADDVWNKLSKFDVSKRDNRDAQRVADVMQKLGFDRKEKRRIKTVDGKTVQRQCWLRKAKEPALPGDGGVTACD